MSRSYIQNWLGLESHPTDEFLNYRVTLEQMEEIRENYNQALKGNKKSLYHLLGSISKIAFEDGQECN